MNPSVNMCMNGGRRASVAEVQDDVHLDEKAR